MVFVGMTSTVRTPPSKVFIFISRSMTAMAARKPSTHVYVSENVRSNAAQYLGQITLIISAICQRQTPTAWAFPLGSKIPKAFFKTKCHQFGVFSGLSLIQTPLKILRSNFLKMSMILYRYNIYHSPLSNQT